MARHPSHAAQGRHSRRHQTLVDLRDGKGEIDDIDHLGNRRVRSSSNWMETSIASACCAWSARSREAFQLVDIDTDAAGPHQRQTAAPRCASSSLVAAVAVHGPDQSVCRKSPTARSLGAWPGGLTRERGRLRGARRASDPLRPDLPDRRPRKVPRHADLLNSPRNVIARVNKYGFVERPIEVKDGRVTDEVVYLSAMEEGRYHVAQANVAHRYQGAASPTTSWSAAIRRRAMITRTRSTYMERVAEAAVSVAAALIPFLENDDANRALMGSNMQRQGRAIGARRSAVCRHRHGRRGRA